MTIRPIEENDNAQVAELMAELGYPVSADLTARKIQEITLDAAGCAYVAEEENRVIGVISFHAIPLLHAEGKLGRITALVVNPTYQRTGIGAKLVQAVEEYARNIGCVKMEVTSSEHRQGAHAFYKKEGYMLSTHGRFIRDL